MTFEERCQTDPQGVIKDLVKQTSKQAAAIHELNVAIEKLNKDHEKQIKELQKEIKEKTRAYIVELRKCAGDAMSQERCDVLSEVAGSLEQIFEQKEQLEVNEGKN